MVYWNDTPTEHRNMDWRRSAQHPFCRYFHGTGSQYGSPNMGLFHEKKYLPIRRWVIPKTHRSKDLRDLTSTWNAPDQTRFRKAKFLNLRISCDQPLQEDQNQQYQQENHEKDKLIPDKQSQQDQDFHLILARAEQLNISLLPGNEFIGGENDNL